MVREDTLNFVGRLVMVRQQWAGGGVMFGWTHITPKPTPVLVCLTKHEGVDPVFDQRNRIWDPEVPLLSGATSTPTSRPCALGVPGRAKARMPTVGACKGSGRKLAVTNFCSGNRSVPIRRQENSEAR